MAWPTVATSIYAIIHLWNNQGSTAKKCELLKVFRHPGATLVPGIWDRHDACTEYLHCSDCNKDSVALEEWLELPFPMWDSGTTLSLARQFAPVQWPTCYANLQKKFPQEFIWYHFICQAVCSGELEDSVHTFHSTETLLGKQGRQEKPNMGDYSVMSDSARLRASKKQAPSGRDCSRQPPQTWQL